MQVVRLSDAERDEFVAERRLGILSTYQSDGGPFSLPLWIGWDGEVVEMMAEPRSPKIKRIRADPRVSVLVANHPDEDARWVQFNGEVTIEEDGLPTAGRLFDKYHPNGPEEMRQAWMKGFKKAAMVRLVLRPARIITYAELF